MSNIIPIAVTLFFSAMIVLLGRAVVVSRLTVTHRSNKTDAYLCAEASLVPEQWPKIKNKLTAEPFTKAKLPFLLVIRGLFVGVINSLSKLYQTWVVIIFIAMVVILTILDTGIDGFSSKFFSAIFYLSLIGTVFFYYFSSIASNISLEEKRVDNTAMLLKKLDWNKLNKEQLNLIKEQIKADYDLYKNATGLSSVLLAISFSVLLLAFRESTNFNFIPLELYIILSVVIFCKWLHESYRSRIVYIALNAVYKVHEDLLVENTGSINNSLEN